MTIPAKIFVFLPAGSLFSCFNKRIMTTSLKNTTKLSALARCCQNFALGSGGMAYTPQ